MAVIRIHRNPGCQPCAEQSARTHKFDWLRRVETSTDVPAEGGEVPPGTIAVQNLQTGEWFRGIAAVREICRHVPLYWPAWLLLGIPAVARWVEARQNQQGHGQVACEVPQRNTGPEA